MPGKKKDRETLTCSAISDTTLNLNSGVQIFSTGEEPPTAFPILGVQIPSGVSTAEVTPRVVHCTVSRICPKKSDQYLVSGILETCLCATPVISGTLTTVDPEGDFVTAGLTISGLQMPYRLQTWFGCLLAVDKSNKKKRSKKHWRVCNCRVTPITNCLSDTSQVPLTLATEAGLTSVCIARSFIARNVVTVTVKQQNKKHWKTDLIHLSDVSPKQVVLPVVSIILSPSSSPLASGQFEPCITLSGTNLQNASAVLFNHLVCGSIISQTPSTLVVRVPCAFPGFLPPVVVEEGEVPTVQTGFSTVTVEVVDVCGQKSNALQLVITNDAAAAVAALGTAEVESLIDLSAGVRAAVCFSYDVCDP